MATRADITPELCRQLLDYDPETGILTWKARTPDMFEPGEAGVRRARTAEHKCANWNARFSGNPALTSRCPVSGHFFGNIGRVPLKAHRVIWAIVHGCWPSGDIDHINGNGSDNRQENLRDVSHAVNMRNSKKRTDNTSGYAGISWFRQTSRWHVRVADGHRSLHVGFFKTIDAAVRARDTAREGLGYTGRSDGSRLKLHGDIVSTVLPKGRR